MMLWFFCGGTIIYVPVNLLASKVRAKSTFYTGFLFNTVFVCNVNIH